MFKNKYYEDKIKQLEQENKLLKMEESRRKIDEIKYKYKDKIIPLREYIEVDNNGYIIRKYTADEYYVQKYPFQEIMNKIDEIIDYINKESNNE